MSAPALSGAAELAVSTGALEAAPLAEVSVDGVTDGVGVSVGVGESLGVGDDGELGSVGFVVVGLDVGGLDVDLLGDGVVCPPPVLLVPLGVSEGRPLSVGVGSSDVP